MEVCYICQRRNSRFERWLEEEGKVAIIGKFLDSHMVHIQAENFLELMAILHSNYTHK